MEIAEFWYGLHYQKEIRDNLSDKQKLSLLNRISDLTLRKAIWIDPDKDYRQEFPEIAPYVSKEVPLSGLYLVAIMKGILSDIQNYARVPVVSLEDG